MHGASWRDGQCEFSVWAPLPERVDLELTGPQARVVPMQRSPEGVWSVRLDGVGPQARYWFRLDGERRLPDPASRRQPEGVHGPSEVVDPRFDWSDQSYRARPWSEQVIYELHVGTFSRAGTFEGVIDRLDLLAQLGVTAIELMPVAQFPGARNWGYDGVYPYCVQDSYGGLRGLQQLVDAAHRRGMAVIVDVVYNHLGPEGNYTAQLAPYFTERYHTPWGAALNFDGAESDHVRRFFIDSALMLIDWAHVDGFRVDAIHAIADASAQPFLGQLCAEVHEAAARRGLPGWVIAESDLNDPRVLLDAAHGGMAFDAQWSDDFHHAVHAYLTGERQGYYEDFGPLEDIARAMEQAFVYTGQYSRHRRRRHGAPPRFCTGAQFVVYTQTHDQVGNRARGDRLSTLVDIDTQRLLAALLALSPHVPMLFQGQEYGETSPFQYFTSHGDPALGEAVRRGRRAEFAAFGWDESQIPDPQSEETFAASRLDWKKLEHAPHAGLWELHRDLFALRRSVPGLRALDQTATRVVPDVAAETLIVHRRAEAGSVIAACNLADTERSVVLPLAGGSWRRIIDTAGAFDVDVVHTDGAHQARLPRRSCLAFTEHTS